MGYYFGEIIRLRSDFFNAYKTGDFIEALSIGDEIIDIYNDNDDCGSTEYANDLNNLAIVYDDICNFTKALELYKEAAKIHNDIFGDDNIRFADIINNIAVIYSRTEKFNEAEKIHTKVMSIREKLLGINHKDYVSSLYNCANAKEDLGKNEEAILFNKRAILKAEKIKDFDKIDYADILSCLGRLYNKIGNYKKSLIYYGRALEILKSDEKNFYYLSNLLSAASVCELCTKYDLAISYYSKAIDIRKKLTNKAHLDYVSNLNSIGKVYTLKNEFSNAIEKYKEALAIVEDIMGKNHIFFTEEISNIGITYCKMGDKTNGLEYINKALDICKKNEFPESFYINMKRNLGKAYSILGEYDNALEIEKNILDKENIKSNKKAHIDVNMDLGYIYFKINDFDIAKNYFIKAIRMRSGEKNTIEYIENLQLIADCHINLYQKDEALEICIKSLDIRYKIFGEDHPNYADGLRILGEIELKGSDFNSAIENLKKALDIYQETIGEENKFYWSTLESLANAYYQQKDYFNAIDSYQELLIYKCDSGGEGVLLSKIGRCYYYIGESIESIQSYENAITYFEKNIDSMADEYIQALLEFSKIYEDLSDFPKSLELLEKCYKKAEVLHIDEIILTNIKFTKGKLIFKSGEIDESILIITETAEKMSKLLESDDPKCSEIYKFLGDIYKHQNDLENALKYYMLALKGIQEIEYLNLLYECGYIYYTKHEYDKALLHFNNGKNYCEEYLNTGNTVYIDIIYYMGCIFQNNNEYENAMGMFEGCIKLRKIENYAKDERYISELTNMGDILCTIDKHSESLEYYSEAASTIKDIFGEGEEFYSAIIRNAHIYQSLGKLDISINLLEKALEINELSDFYQLEKSMEIKIKIGKIFFEDKNYTQAITYLEDVYETSRQSGKKSIFDNDSYEILMQSYKKEKKIKKIMLLKTGKPLTY